MTDLSQFTLLVLVLKVPYSGNTSVLGRPHGWSAYLWVSSQSFPCTFPHSTWLQRDRGERSVSNWTSNPIGAVSYKKYCGHAYRVTFFSDTILRPQEPMQLFNYFNFKHMKEKNLSHYSNMLGFFLSFCMSTITSQTLQCVHILNTDFYKCVIIILLFCDIYIY